MLRNATLALSLSLAAIPAMAQAPGSSVETNVPEDVLAVHRALLLPDIIAVMVREGEEYGAELAPSVFGLGPVPAEWSEIVSAIYDPDHLESKVLESLAHALEGQDTTAILGFLESETGRTLAELELEARQAMVDEDVEQEAREAAAVAMAENSPRMELLRRYAEENGLLESNVAGAMNSNYAYVMGLLDGDALPTETTEEDVLADVWAQEPLIRANSVEWLYAYLLRAYGPASDADLQALIEFSATGPGQALNRAVFDAFEARHIDISRALGLAAARFLTSRAI